jgi:RND family efflux transporter MFP subunit
VYETFQTSITAARTSIETALSEVRAARSEYDTAAASVAVATKERERTNAPARTEAERAQFAQLAVAREAARVIRAQLNERVLTSPIAATVANIYLDPGEAVGALQPVADLLSPSTFELQAFIPEADIAHVKLGDHARVTFDAFDRTAVFNAKVIRISDGETVRDGVPTYKTTFVLTDMPEGAGTLRAGMSADIEIETALHKDVLAVPSRSVIAEGDRTYVRVVTGTDQYEERDVVTGLRGSEGTTEIVSGITASDRVVVFIDGA